MKRWLYQHSRVVTISALSLVAGGLVFCRLTPGCLLARAQTSQSPVAADYERGGTTSPDLQTPRQVEHADQATFEDLVLRSEVPVLVDFYADWCVPCQMQASRLREFAEETSEARIVKVNVDDNPELADRYAVSAIPTLLVFKGGKVTAEHVGLADKGQLRGLLLR
jgi:thioredoxin 1